MTMYAETPGLRSRQLLLDGLVAAWSIAWIAAGFAVYRLVNALSVFGRAVESSGRSLSGELGSAAQRAGDLPLLGDQLATPFQGAADASTRLAEAGLAQQQSVSRLALTLALVVALAPIAAVVAAWLPPRLRWFREARAAVALRSSTTADVELLAMRALARRPLRELTAISGRPWAALRDGDRAAIEQLASLELAALGLVGPGRSAPDR